MLKQQLVQLAGCVVLVQKNLKSGRHGVALVTSACYCSFAIAVFLLSYFYCSVVIAVVVAVLLCCGRIVLLKCFLFTVNRATADSIILIICTRHQVRINSINTSAGPQIRLWCARPACFPSWVFVGTREIKMENDGQRGLLRDWAMIRIDARTSTQGFVRDRRSVVSLTVDITINTTHYEYCTDLLIPY